MGASVMPMGTGHGAGTEAPPYGIPSKKLAMWLFIIADACTFGAMLFAYGYLRVANPNWTRPFAFWPTIANGIVMTVVKLPTGQRLAIASCALRAL